MIQMQLHTCNTVFLSTAATLLIAGLLQQVPAAQAALDNLRKLVENHAHR